MSDPVTGKTDSLLRNDGFDPLWIETNTSTEYWQKGASLLTTDPLGENDVELPAKARVYLIAGTQHGRQAWLRPQPRTLHKSQQSPQSDPGAACIAACAR